MILIADTREKKTWKFSSYDCRVEPGTLKAGDYSLAGYEHRISIERKASTGEVAGNLGKYRERFERELTILADYDVVHLICEFPEEYLLTFPRNSGIPRKYWRRIRINGPYLHKTIFGLAEQYGFELSFHPDRFSAEDHAYKILKEFYDQNFSVRPT